jgi:hypothetical protein
MEGNKLRMRLDMASAFEGRRKGARNDATV